MYLTMVAKFSDFLSSRGRTLQEILDHLVRVALLPLDVRSALYVQTNDSNEYYVAGQSGVASAAAAELEPHYSLSDNTPPADVIRNGKILWLPNRPETFNRYPVLEKYPQLIGNHALIVVPVFSSDVPVAALTLFSRLELENISHFESFLTALCSVFSLYFYRTTPATPIEPKLDAYSGPRISPVENS